MKCTLSLWDEIPGDYTQPPVLECWLPEERSCDAAVVILPGGGYAMLADHEGTDYARFLYDHGIACFVCRYRVYPHRFPLPLLDARRAVRYVRHHREKFGIDPDSVYLMGSSAGGHLTAMTSTYHEKIWGEGVDAIDRESCRPNGQILCYPVIKLLGREVAHLGSGTNLLGEHHAEMGELLSPDLIAGADTPRAFIWHTFEDSVVNVINALDYARRLRQVNVPVEMHIFPEGNHGLGLAPDFPLAYQWPQLLLNWIRHYEA